MVMFEWDESKRLWTLEERNLDFQDATLFFDGRPVLHIPARWINEIDLLHRLFWTVNVLRLYGRGGEVTAGLFHLGERKMSKKKGTVRYTVKQIAKMKSKTDWAKSAAMTYEQIEASIAADPDEAGMVIDWNSATIEMPQPKAVLNMRVDRDVLDYFKKKGRGYQTTINAILRNYVEHHADKRV